MLQGDGKLHFNCARSEFYVVGGAAAVVVAVILMPFGVHIDRLKCQIRQNERYKSF